jgi:hypothetical protein
VFKDVGHIDVIVTFHRDSSKSFNSISMVYLTLSQIIEFYLFTFVEKSDI